MNQPDDLDAIIAAWADSNAELARLLRGAPAGPALTVAMRVPLTTRMGAATVFFACQARTFCYLQSLHPGTVRPAGGVLATFAALLFSFRGSS